MYTHIGKKVRKYCIKFMNGFMFVGN